jgi:hypothetical protein
MKSAGRYLRKAGNRMQGPFRPLPSVRSGAPNFLFHSPLQRPTGGKSGPFFWNFQGWHFRNGTHVRHRLHNSVNRYPRGVIHKRAYHDVMQGPKLVPPTDSTNSQ